MKVDTTNLREVLWDCPWTGHVPDPRFRLTNSSAPNVIGLRCIKCGCLIYEFVEVSQVVGADGSPLPQADGGADADA